jgi:hypothetical protein
MNERPNVTANISHDAAIVIAGMLADYFNGGRGPLAERTTRVQDIALSELLSRLEKCDLVSPIMLGPGFIEELDAASQRIEKANWPNDSE